MGAVAPFIPLAISAAGAASSIAGKGGGKSGSQTVVQNNTPWNAPYLADLFGVAKNLHQNNSVDYYPGQTLYEDPYLSQGYDWLARIGDNIDATLIPSGNSIFYDAASGGMGVQASPVYAALMGLATGAASPLKSLDKSAAGSYLNANPHLGRMYDAAAGAVTRNYQTATAPQTDSVFERAGRYGSGAMMNARSQNERNLGSTLSNLASSIYGTNYSNERQLMQDAAIKSAGLRTAAAGQVQDSFDTGNTNELRALGLFPSVLEANAYPAELMVRGGTGLTGLGQARIQDEINRWNANEMAPWQNAQRYAGLLGNPISGTQSTTQPLYSNPAANILGAGLGLTGILGQTQAFGTGGWLTGSPSTSWASNAAGNAVSPFADDAIDFGGSTSAGLLSSLFGAW